MTAGDLDLIPHAVGLMPDHAHVVVSIPPRVSVAEAVKRLKGASARAVNQRIPTGNDVSFNWQAEYGALSFGENALARVIDYVDHQRERHAIGQLITKLEQMDDGYTKPNGAG